MRPWQKPARCQVHVASNSTEKTERPSTPPKTMVPPGFLLQRVRCLFQSRRPVGVWRRVAAGRRGQVKLAEDKEKVTGLSEVDVAEAVESEWPHSEGKPNEELEVKVLWPSRRH